MLTKGEGSSGVVDYLCGQAGERNTTISCFYFNFAEQKEQPQTRILGSILKQLVFGLEEIPEEISKTFKDRKNAVGGQAPQISDILNMLHATCTRKRAFICIDAVDECATEHQVKLLNSLGQLLQQPPGT